VIKTKEEFVLRKRKGIHVHSGIIEKGVYQTLKVTSNSTGVFCRKEE